MAQYDIGTTNSTTNMANTVKDVTIGPSYIDSAEGLTFWDFPDANTQLTYYKTIPEIHSALHVFAQRVCGLGYQSPQRVILQRMFGWGNETFTSIISAMLIEKKVFADSFAEAVRNEKGTLINLKRLYTGDIRIAVNEKGLIEYYQHRTSAEDPWRKIQPEDMLHFTNRRVGNEIHGTSDVDALKKIIDAKNEGLSDERKIRHRELALGILEIDSSDPAVKLRATQNYQNAVNKGEVLVIEKGTAELKDNPNAPRDRIQWLQYLDNLFYQVIGTPKVLVTSEGYTEAGGKAGLLAFEPTEIAEKLELEENILMQLGIQIKFARAPSLLGNEQETQSKNAGQTGIQNNERSVSLNRTE